MPDRVEGQISANGLQTQRNVQLRHVFHGAGVYDHGKLPGFSRVANTGNFWRTT